MSKSNELKILTHGEVHKKIVRDPTKARPKEELLGPLNKYRDENFEIYNTKKKQFLETAKKYYRLNQETLICSKKRLQEDYREMLDCGFLKEEKEDEETKDDGTTGKLLRKRTERPIQQEIKQPDKPCTMEPWFGRYLKLNKFIWAARTIILKNRLLKVLEKLKTVTNKDILQLEKRKVTYPNISYAEIFEKFM